MAAKTRERAAFAYLNGLRERYAGQVVSADLLQSLYCDFADYFFPEIEKSSPAERHAAYSRIMDWLESLDDETEASVATAKQIGGLKANSRSDSMWVNKVPFPESGLLAHDKSNPARWVKKITHQKSDNDTTAEATADAETETDTVE